MANISLAALAGWQLCAIGTAHAATAMDPDTFCAAKASPRPGGADPAIAEAAATAETMIAAAPDRAAAADQAITMLSDMAAKATLPGEADLAAYCAAAGEAFRVGRAGNPYQARALLNDAFRHAEASGASKISALAAYRLGLITDGGAMAGARGLRRSIAASPESPGKAVPASDDVCATLANPAIADAGAAYFATIALRCAVNRANAGGDVALAARAGLKLARFWLDYGRRTPAEADKAKVNAGRIAIDALTPAARVDDPQMRLTLLGRIAEVAIDADQGRDPRLGAVPRAMRAAAGDQPAGRAAAEAIEGRLALAVGDAQRAADHLRRAIFLEAQAPIPLRLADWQLLLAAADPAHRQEHVAAAFRALEAVRPLLGGYDAITEESNFSLRIRPIFEASIETRLGTLTGDDDARLIAETQNVAEEYRQAELQSLFGSECVAARPPVTPAELQPGEMLLYPILLPDRVELLYALGGGVGAGPPRYHRLPPDRGVRRDDVVALVGAMVDSTSYGDDDAWKEPARRLYQALIAPVADKLTPEGTLVIVPDGPLSALPFAALLDDQGRYLIERTRIDVVPALAYAQPGKPRGEAPPAVVAAALEKEVRFPFGTYQQLAGTGEEARFAIGAGQPGAGRNLLIENFRRADLVRALGTRRIDVLHLATHANFNGRSDRSYIVADGELIPIADLRAMIARSQTRGDQLDLIVLSACESAVGDDEASMGLAGAAVQAGARSALASLWQVNDIGTAALMKGFYARYRAGAGKADALRGAQLALIHGGGATANPNIWAAFTLLGSWR